MSWLERANAAVAGAAPSAGAPQEALRRGDAAARLREQVNRIVGPDVVVALAARNPEGARNELRSACRRAFAEEWWDEFSDIERARLVNDLLDTVFGFGPLEELLADDSVTEIMVNGARTVFFEREGRIYPSECAFADDDQVRTVIDRILGPLGRRIDEASPLVDARLPEGHRVNAVIPPISPDGPVLTIRKFSKRVIRLERMEETGSLEAEVRSLLEWAVLLRKSIAVTGGTGSGKTTLLNALSCVIPAAERIITIEDSAELRFHEHPHVVRMEARPRNAEGTGEISIRQLVQNALRMRPDRIVVGECRGPEAWDMLQAMNTGHEGSLTTLHANSPREAVSRLTALVRYTADLPVDVIEASIASALDMVVQTARTREGMRYVSEVASFSYDADARECVLSSLYKRGPLDARGTWTAAPAWLDDVAAYGFATQEEVAAWRSRIC